MVSRQLPPGEGGHCNGPSVSGKRIAVCSSIRSPQTLLENLIHEMLHACFWDMDEEAIEETGEAIARTLIRLGVTIDVAKVHEKLKEEVRDVE